MNPTSIAGMIESIRITRQPGGGNLHAYHVAWVDTDGRHHHDYALLDPATRNDPAMIVTLAPHRLVVELRSHGDGVRAHATGDGLSRDYEIPIHDHQPDG